MCDIIHIKEPFLTNIKKLVIPPINIIDLFPMMKSGLSTIVSICKLNGMFSKLDSYTKNGENNWFYTPLKDELRDKVVEEEDIMEEISKIARLLGRVQKSVTIFTIAIAIQAVKSRIDFDEHFKSHIHDKIIELFLRHPKIDPLCISLTQIDVSGTRKFLNDPRSNKLFVYKKAPIDTTDRLEIREIIYKEIVLRIFLYKEYFLSLPKDLFTYFMGLEIF